MLFFLQYWFERKSHEWLKSVNITREFQPASKTKAKVFEVHHSMQLLSQHTRHIIHIPISMIRWKGAYIIANEVHSGRDHFVFYSHYPTCYTFKEIWQVQQLRFLSLGCRPIQSGACTMLSTRGCLVTSLYYCILYKSNGLTTKTAFTGLTVCINMSKWWPGSLPVLSYTE